MVPARSEARMVHTHILHNVSGRADGTPLQLALEEEGIENIFTLINIDTPTIDNLQYIDTNNNNAIIHVGTGDKMLLKCCLSYTHVRHNEGNPIDDDWVQITHAEFDSFRVEPKYIIPPSSKLSSMSPTASNSTITLSTQQFNSVEMFRRGIKRDATLFPTLKDDKYHNVWHQSFNTQATAQAVSEVLDDSYVPTTSDDIALFQEKQKYLYAVLESRVLTDRGKAFIRDHEHDFDAKKVYQKLKAYLLRSTKAKM
jgi:hypothetical protein